MLDLPGISKRKTWPSEGPETEFMPVMSNETLRYSVPARLIGQELKVEVYELELKLYSGRELLLSLPRHPGNQGMVVDYRHVIDHLLRKPGAF